MQSVTESPTVTVKKHLGSHHELRLAGAGSKLNDDYLRYRAAHSRFP